MGFYTYLLALLLEVVTASSAFLNTVKEKKTLMKVFYINLSDSSLP